MVYRRFGTRNCSCLSLVVGISDGFVGSKYRHNDHDGPSTNYAWLPCTGKSVRNNPPTPDPLKGQKDPFRASWLGRVSLRAYSR